VIGLVAPYEPIGQQAVGSIYVRGVAAGGVNPKQNEIAGRFVNKCPEWIILGRAQYHWGVVSRATRAVGRCP